MNLVEDNYGNNSKNKKIYVICGASIAILFLIIVALLAFVTSLKGNEVTLYIDGKNVSKQNCLLNKENVIYIGIEDVVSNTKNGYSYKRGSLDDEDENRCYITNSYETTFFEVGSYKVYKIIEDTNEVEYYTIEKPIIKENDKIYMPISAVEIATNVNCRNSNNQIVISSIAYIENTYNKETSANFVTDDSIVWETTYSNKKLLKNYIVIVKDNENKLGLATISSSTVKDGKTTKTIVKTESIIDPKYLDIRYVEQFNQVIVESEKGRGIIQLFEENGKIGAERKIDLQYDDVKTINDDLYLIAQNVETITDGTSKATKKYGIIDKEGNYIVPVQYDGIGLDISEFTNNNVTNKYIILDKYIPVKKGTSWGIVNLSGNVVINPEYTDLGCTTSSSNSNVLIIPEINGIVVRKDKTYGIVSTDGKVLIKNVLAKVYKEKVDGKDVYYMIYNNTKYNVIDYITKSSQEKNNTANKTNATNKTNTTNTSNTTNATNKTNTTNASNTTNATNKNNTTKVN